jgi:hypothetical protein
VLAALERYGSKTPQELVDLTRAEGPWLDAWTGDRSRANEIPVSELESFFTDLAKAVPTPTAAARAMASRMQRFMTEKLGGDS